MWVVSAKIRSLFKVHVIDTSLCIRKKKEVFIVRRCNVVNKEQILFIDAVEAT